MGTIFHVLFFTFIVKLLVQSLKLLLTTCKLENNFQQLPSLTKNVENCDVQLSGKCLIEKNCERCSTL